MPKICIQAGHKGTLIGATGAPGERDWNSKIVSLIATKLKTKGFEVYEADAKADKDSKVTGTDWDLFLAVHYDADIYNDRGGFVDYPDKSVDMVHETSKGYAEKISDYYFKTTGIPNRPNRSNANTKFYYMWSSLSAKTPCVLIECGVGNRKPQDYDILRNYDFISQTLTDAILKVFNVSPEKPCDHTACKKDLEDMRNSRNEWKEKATKAEDKLKKIQEVLNAK